MKPHRRRVPPPAILAGTLLVIITAGTVLLRLPIAHENEPIGWIDALFTATSAACVTGLVVVDTGSQFSFFGEAVILALMQIGGLGVMTIGTIIIMALGQRPSPAVRAVLRSFTSHRPTLRVRDILGMVALFTGVLEAAGAMLLFVVFAREHAWSEAAWLAVFHSVSAFCNAGFGLWPDSLTRYAGDPLVNATVMTLIVAGGVGFVVLVEMRTWASSRLRRNGARDRLSLHTKIVLAGTALAILTGAGVFLVLEAANVLQPHSWPERLWIAGFQSVTTRTAGFNTVDTGALSNPTLLVFMVLMFVGAGPGSASGGIKLTSAAAVLALVFHRLRGSRDIRLFGRAIGDLTMQRAVVLAFMAALLILATIIAIELDRTMGALDLEARGELLSVTFETVSAFGTVGLSMGITPNLEPLSKLLLVLLMFAGRLGPLTLMDVFEHLPQPPPVRYATEELVIG